MVFPECSSTLSEAVNHSICKRNLQEGGAPALACMSEAQPISFLLLHSRSLPVVGISIFATGKDQSTIDVPLASWRFWRLEKSLVA